MCPELPQPPDQKQPVIIVTVRPNGVMAIHLCGISISEAQCIICVAPKSRQPDSSTVRSGSLAGYTATSIDATPVPPSFVKPLLKAVRKTQRRASL